MDELAALEELVRLYSPSGNERAAVEGFGAIARRLGYDFTVDPAGNGVARIGNGRPRTMFLGHIDTVPGELPVTAEADVVAGRGACDAKGPLVAALWAGSRARGRGEWTVVAAVGEEDDSRGARALAKSAPPDQLIIGEPTGGAGVGIAYRGQLRLRYRAATARAHLSAPTSTAPDRVLEWVGQVREVAHRFVGPTGFGSVTTKVVALQSAFEAGVECATVTLDVRLPPAVPWSTILPLLRPSVEMGYLEVVWATDAVELNRGNPVVRALVRGIRHRAMDPTLYRKAGTSDLNVVWPVWRCPAAVYGPGDPHLDHTDAERLSADELRSAVRVLAHALTELREEWAKEPTSPDRAPESIRPASQPLAAGPGSSPHPGRAVHPEGIAASSLGRPSASTITPRRV